MRRLTFASLLSRWSAAPSPAHRAWRAVFPHLVILGLIGLAALATSVERLGPAAPQVRDV